MEINTCHRLFTGKRACVGYENGSLRIWDLKGGTILHNVSGNVKAGQPTKWVVNFPCLEIEVHELCSIVFVNLSL